MYHLKILFVLLSMSVSHLQMKIEYDILQDLLHHWFFFSFHDRFYNPFFVQFQNIYLLFKSLCICISMAFVRITCSIVFFQDFSSNRNSYPQIIIFAVNLSKAMMTGKRKIQLSFIKLRSSQLFPIFWVFKISSSVLKSRRLCAQPICSQG